MVYKRFLFDIMTNNHKIIFIHGKRGKK